MDFYIYYLYRIKMVSIKKTDKGRKYIKVKKKRVYLKTLLKRINKKRINENRKPLKLITNRNIDNVLMELLSKPKFEVKQKKIKRRRGRKGKKIPPLREKIEKKQKEIEVFKSFEEAKKDAENRLALLNFVKEVRDNQFMKKIPDWNKDKPSEIIEKIGNKAINDMNKDRKEPLSKDEEQKLKEEVKKEFVDTRNMFADIINLSDDEDEDKSINELAIEVKEELKQKEDMSKKEFEKELKELEDNVADLEKEMDGGMVEEDDDREQEEYQLIINALNAGEEIDNEFRDQMIQFLDVNRNNLNDFPQIQRIINAVNVVNEELSTPPQNVRIIVDKKEMKGGLLLEKDQALTNNEIDQIMKRYKNFYGAIPVDMGYRYMPQIKEKSEGAVIYNLDASGQPGSHWVGLYWNGGGKKPQICYYDSFGRDPPMNIMNDIKQIVKILNADKHMKMKISKVVNQDKTSVSCGYMAIRFIMDMMRGGNFKKATGYGINKSEDKAEKMFKKFKYLII